MKNIKFKSIISIALVCYIIFIASIFVDELEDMKVGFLQGKNAASRLINDEQGSDTFYISVAPKVSVLNFPETMENIKCNEEIKIRYYKMKVMQPIGLKLNLRNKIYRVICTFLAFVVYAVFVFIPFQFYGLMKTLQKEIFFDVKNKKRFINIGAALGIAYWAIFLANYLSFQISNSLFEFKDYVIIKEHTNVIWMLLSLVTLIIAEMISRGIKLREEQDLTI